MDAKPQLEHLGQDLLVTPFYAGDSWSTVDLVLRPGQSLGGGRGPHRSDTDDLGVAAGVDALRQALVLRLLTPRGSLADLGHAGYGSRIHELIGRENNRSNRLVLRALVLETLLQEPRVAKVEVLEIVPDTVSPETVHVHAQVRPVGPEGEIGDPAVSLSLEVQL